MIDVRSSLTLILTSILVCTLQVEPKGPLRFLAETIQTDIALQRRLIQVIPCSVIRWGLSGASCFELSLNIRLVSSSGGTSRDVDD
jgi:hypothetical protein